MKIDSPIIEPLDLFELTNSDNLIIVDVSNEENYHKHHLSGAVFVDLNSQLADIKSDFSDGGRHPLPPIQDFIEIISTLGISRNSHVVAYDHSSGANAAARFWWMLKAVGHENVQVLNGGFQAAEVIGYPIDSQKVEVEKAKIYDVDQWQLHTNSMEEVKDISLTNKTKLIDVRSEERYSGSSEPLDLIAGHIPSAINIPYTSNLDENGFFLKPEALKVKYEKVLADTPSKDAIFYCGSGVSACHSLLALAYAGMEIPQLYVGSWSEWSRNNEDMIGNF